MADERANIDDNFTKTLIAETKEGEIRRVRTNEQGFLLTDTGATVTGIAVDALKVADENTIALRQLIVEQRITNKILNEVHDLHVDEEDLR